MRSAALGVLLAALPWVVPAPAETVEQLRTELLDIELNAERCYRVRDLFLERDDVKLYFTDGYLIFADAVRGRSVAALFIADTSADEGEVLVIPPTAQERQSLSRFTGDAVLNEKFRSALMLFTDDTATVLEAELDRTGSTPNPERGQRLGSRWSPVLRNILDGVSVRILDDLISELPQSRGLFAAAIGGGPLGRFDLIVDPRHAEQVWIGQTVWREGERRFDTWCRFTGLSFREKQRSQVEFGGRVERYRIDSTIADDLSMVVSARASLRVEAANRRSFGFEISRELTVDEVLIDGVPTEFVKQSETSLAGSLRHFDQVVLVLAPQPIEQGRRIEIEFGYRGRVITRAGNGVYLVGSRGSWYPRGKFEFSDYELTFHFPSGLDLLATGELVEESEDAGVRSSTFRSQAPLRIAGFNLGNYISTSREFDGYRVEVRANRGAEDSLQRQVKGRIVPISPGVLRRRRGAPAPLLISTPQVVLRPGDRIDEVADSTAEAFRYFIDLLGPPPVRQIALTPIPGAFGQGFPGLVYAATRSYLDPDEPPLDAQPQSVRDFYSKLLRPHEVSHQWWGNLVTADNASESWILEALATYSALLLLEEREGAAALDAILAQYKANLLAPTDKGETIEQAGPIVMGERLRSGLTPEAYRIIVYEKGAWIIHMLRTRIGDDRFREFLRSLTERFAYRAITTEEFRAAATEFLPDDDAYRSLEDFFDQWVYRSGIPELSARWKRQGDQTIVTITQQGVSAAFSTPLELELTFGGDQTVRKRVWTDGETTELTFSAAEAVTGLSIDPDRRLLAIRR